jgi:phosphomevalonate kinase
MAAVDSRRFYVALADALAQVGTINNATVTSAILNQAEELIDQYVGPQPSWYRTTLIGRCAAGSNATTIVLQANKDQNAYQKDFFKNMEVEIIGGTGAGQTAHIQTSLLSGTLTLYETLTTALDTTSMYKIAQLGKFPRIEDVYLDGYNSPVQYYKNAPKKVQDAVIEQCRYILKMGASFFITDSYGMDQEIIDNNYRYQRKNMAGDLSLLIAPEAKLLLRGITNRKGQFIDAGL